MSSVLQFLWHFLQNSSKAALGVGLRYVMFAGIAWLLGYVFFTRHWWHRKIIPRLPQSEDVWREVRYSIVTLFVFGMVGAATLMAVRAGWTFMYWPIAKHGWLWFWVSIGCAIVLHDTYFYWTHRLMHHRLFFRAFHRVHHLSHNPSPWAAYSFAPLEAVVEAGIFPLAMFTIPMHPAAFAVFMVWQISFNVVGHTGYEIHPRWLMDSWLGRLMNTPTNHVMHHETMRGNYGLYFNVWDRLMGTNHQNYEKRFREVTSRKPEEKPAAAEQPAAPEPLATP